MALDIAEDFNNGPCHRPLLVTSYEQRNITLDDWPIVPGSRRLLLLHDVAYFSGFSFPKYIEIYRWIIG
jgi:hypothetical protein